jgi:hypothetical protein
MLTTATSSTPTILFALIPTSSGLGGRINAIAATFTSFKVVKAVVKFIHVSSASSSSVGVLGFLDDSGGGEGDAPTTTSAVSELRCAGTNFSSETVPTEILYQPVDGSKWFYCQQGASGSDQRLTEPAVIFAASTSSGNFALELDILWAFKGASDNASL